MGVTIGEPMNALLCVPLANHLQPVPPASSICCIPRLQGRRDPSALTPGPSVQSHRSPIPDESRYRPRRPSPHGDPVILSSTLLTIPHSRPRLNRHSIANTMPVARRRPPCPRSEAASPVPPQFPACGIRTAPVEPLYFPLLSSPVPPSVRPRTRDRLASRHHQAYPDRLRDALSRKSFSSCSPRLA
jgi:hypothetical protein